MQTTAKKLPPVEELRELLDYNPDTGELRWKSNGRHAGNFTRGYRQIPINGRKYMAHRLAWLMFYETEPSCTIDHSNLNRSDNRICNLREATPSENNRNRPRGGNNTSGFKGVYWSKSVKKWLSQITINGKWKYLGVFADINDAADAYARAAKSIHGEFGRIS